MSKYKFDNLPLVMYASEQESVTIPTEKINITEDKDLITNIDNDARIDKFLYAYTDSGLSANSRNWKPEIMTSIAEQVLTKLPVGYLGHIKPSEYGYEFPDPQVVWFGSYIEEITKSDETKFNRLWLKGYLLPTSTKLESWIKAKAVDSISVYGKIQYTDNKGVMDISAIDLKSIDISRKLGEGLNSKIVTIASEMDIEYNDVRRSIENVIKDRVKASLPTEFNSDGSVKSKYVYCWCKSLYINNNTGIVSVEYDGSDKIYKFDYSINDETGDVTVGDLKEVIKNVEYKDKVGGNVIKTDGTEGNVTDVGSECKQNIGEMNNNIQGGKKMGREEIIQSLTLEEIQKHNPSFLTNLKTAVASEMSSEANQKTMLAKSQKFDEVIGVIGGEQENIVSTVNTILSNNKAFVSSLSKVLFAGESDEGAEATPEKVVAKAEEVVKENKDNKEVIEEVSKVVGKDENETLIEAATKVVEANKINRNTSWVKNVNDKFTELSKGKDGKNPINETVLEFVREDYEAILDAKPEDISEEDWEATAIAYMDDNFQSSVDKYAKRLGNLIKNSKAVGEMNAFEKLGTNLAGEQENDEEDEDADLAYAKSLGYN